jgi:flap endonuclease GEN
LEKKDEHKKQKRRTRPKKSAQAAINHVDAQLQELLLAIESESGAFPSTASGAQPGHIGTLAPINDIVDLSSPSPPLRACKIARSRNFSALDTITMDEIDLLCQSLQPGTVGPQDNGTVLCSVQCLTQDSGPIDLSSPLASAAHKPQSSQDDLALNVEVERRALSDISNVPEKGSMAVDSCRKHEGGANHMDVQPLSSHGAGLAEAGEADCPWRCDTESNAVSEPAMIDLSSPLPVIRGRGSNNEPGADVIDVGESDSDRSPEHDRKARELRLFLDSIRHQL